MKFAARRTRLRHTTVLIIPGGESSVQGKLLCELGLMEPLRQKIQDGVPVFGTCAGLLLLAKDIVNDERRHLATMNIRAVRNAYGRQLGSFSAAADFADMGKIPMTFIRAPYIASGVWRRKGACCGRGQNRGRRYKKISW